MGFSEVLIQIKRPAGTGGLIPVGRRKIVARGLGLCSLDFMRISQIWELVCSIVFSHLVIGQQIVEWSSSNQYQHLQILDRVFIKKKMTRKRRKENRKKNHVVSCFSRLWWMKIWAITGKNKEMIISTSKTTLMPYKCIPKP